MKKQTIKLNEVQLQRMIEEGVKKYLNENATEEGFFGNVWGGVKNAAQKTGQGIAQRGNKLMADYNAGAAQNAQQDIQKQIQKSQQVIAKEQQKINDLRNKYNQYVNKADAYTDKANQNAQNRGSNTRYNGYGMQQDTNTQDFYNQNDMNKAKFSSRMQGAQQANRKMRRQEKPAMYQAAGINESKLDNIIRNVLKENFA